MKLLNNLLSKWWFVPLLIGIAIRLILMPITAHSDLWALYFSGHLFAFDGITNIYDYLANLPSNSDLLRNYGSNFFTYPPLIYYIFGFFTIVLKPLLSADLGNWIVGHYPNIYTNPEIYREIFLFKLPYLFIDIGAAFVLSKLVDQPKSKKIIFSLWMINPLVLYSTFMVGQFDIIAVFFVILSLYFAKRDKKYLSVISIGFGGALKMFPLLFLPFFVFSLGKNWKDKIGLIIAGLLPYVLLMLPFLNSPAFRQNVLFSAQSQKMFFMTLPVSGAEGIPVFILGYFLLIYMAATLGNTRPVWTYCLAVLALFFSITHFHPQWIIWIIPLFIIDIVYGSFRHLWLWLLIFLCWLGITLMFESSLNYGLFVPVNPRLFESPQLSEIINHYYNVFQLKSLLRGIMASSLLFIVYEIFKKNQTISQ